MITRPVTLDAAPSGRCNVPNTPATRALPKIRPSDRAELVLRSALAGAIARIQANDPSVRRGEAEGVHRLRTTTRRLRGELRAFRHLLHAGWREPIENDLKWLANALGGVRDLDVLDERLREAAGRLRWDDRAKYPESTPAAALDPLFESISRRHAEATSNLRGALCSDRYADLVESIGRSLGSVVDGLKDGAEAPCREVLPPLVRAAWRHLKRGARDLKPGDPEDAFHDVRKRSKRARYTAELIAPALGRKAADDARRFIQLATRVQDALGEHQDAAVSIEEITRARAEHPGDDRFLRANSLLIEDQRQAAESARASFFKLWEKLDRRNVRRWME